VTDISKVPPSQPRKVSGTSSLAKRMKAAATTDKGKKGVGARMPEPAGRVLKLAATQESAASPTAARERASVEIKQVEKTEDESQLLSQLVSKIIEGNEKFTHDDFTRLETHWGKKMGMPKFSIPRALLIRKIIAKKIKGAEKKLLYLGSGVDLIRPFITSGSTNYTFVDQCYKGKEPKLFEANKKLLDILMGQKKDFKIDFCSQTYEEFFKVDKQQYEIVFDFSSHLDASTEDVTSEETLADVVLHTIDERLAPGGVWVSQSASFDSSGLAVKLLQLVGVSVLLEEEKFPERFVDLEKRSLADIKKALKKVFNPMVLQKTKAYDSKGLKIVMKRYPSWQNELVDKYHRKDPSYNEFQKIKKEYEKIYLLEITKPAYKGLITAIYDYEIANTEDKDGKRDRITLAMHKLNRAGLLKVLLNEDTEDTGLMTLQSKVIEILLPETSSQKKAPQSHKKNPHRRNLSRRG